MKYKEKSAQGGLDFRPWQPSTWPAGPTKVNSKFVNTLTRIFKESMLEEIRNVVEDIKHNNGNLEHRGHVVAIALMCALDAVSSYGYNGRHVEKFVRSHFPAEYRSHAGLVYRLYRNSLVHSWNLFEATLLPGNEGIKMIDGTLSFGLLDFLHALETGIENFLMRLETDSQLQENSLARYKDLKRKAKP